MKLVPLSPSHAKDAARLHMAGQPGTFLTSLGFDVLTVLYRTLPQTSAGFGYAIVSEVNDHPPFWGFISATTSVGSLFAEIGLRHSVQFIPPLMKRFLQQPSLIIRSAQTVLYPFINSEKEEQSNISTAELLSIMVEPPMRSQGIGEQLLQALVDDCQAQEIEQLDVTVDAKNLGAQRFYKRHGFEQRKEFVLYGREMQSYRRAISR